MNFLDQKQFFENLTIGCGEGDVLNVNQQLVKINADIGADDDLVHDRWQ